MKRSVEKTNGSNDVSNIVSAKRPKLSYADLVKKRNKLKRLLEDTEKELDIQRKVLPKQKYRISGREKVPGMRGSKPEPFSHEVQIVTNKQDKSISDKMHWKHTAQYGQLIVSRNKLTDKLGSPYKAPHGYRKYDDVGRENGSCVRELFVVGIHSIDEKTYDLTSKSSYVEIFDDKGVDYNNCGKSPRPSVDEVKIWAVSGNCSHEQFIAFMKTICRVLECSGSYNPRSTAAGLSCAWGIEITK